jgi:D-aminopeptidase
LRISPQRRHSTVSFRIDKARNRRSRRFNPSLERGIGRQRPNHSRVRARDLGIAIGAGRPGPNNAITDIAAGRVGHTTLVEGDSVRTGVTVLFPHEGEPALDPIFAGAHRLNGNGELTGLEWVRESGLLTSPVGLTNTFSVGVVRDALVAAAPAQPEWHLPVVGETYDGFLNDARGMHVRPEHVEAALARARGGAVAEGSVGGGTGMICHHFKGGIGTASRVVDNHTVGVLVQANHGRRARFRVDGLPVGEAIGERIPLPGRGGEGAGSIIGIVGTDAPLLPNQCRRLAQRAALGVARTGGVGEHSSGDLFLAFATGNRGLAALEEPGEVELRMLSYAHATPLFDAVVEATEEAILNALLAAETMTGREGNTVYGLEPDVLVETLERLRPRPG